MRILVDKTAGVWVEKDCIASLRGVAFACQASHCDGCGIEFSGSDSLAIVLVSEDRKIILHDSCVSESPVMDDQQIGPTDELEAGMDFGAADRK